VRRAGAAADHRRDAGCDGVVDLLRADEMDVSVDAAGGDDAAFAGDDLGGGDPMVMVMPSLEQRVARVADANDAAVFDADVRLDDAVGGIEDEGVGDDEIEDSASQASGDCAMPSRMTLPPPNFTSLP
jgi:hypothetical protein